MKALKFVLYLSVALGAAFLFVAGIVVIIYSLKNGFDFPNANSMGPDIFNFICAVPLFYFGWIIGDFALKRLGNLK